MNWYRMDLHLHTPGSNDYLQPDIDYLSILQQAERRGLHIIAFTDHNTVRGYREMLDEVDRLRWLEDSGRIDHDEAYRLGEYRRLFEKLMILPGFEFTATFGFHILGIFPPDTHVRYLEHLLLDLKVPANLLDVGETNVGATADVLEAYRKINEAGGVVIAAHANSNNGVAMMGFPLGGQTRIAYTQDPNLHVLEVTDLDRRGRRTTQRFFDGSKAEYPRQMRCIQGSDAHRVEADPTNTKRLGIGDRVTEILLKKPNWEQFYEVMTSNDLTRTRPYRGRATPYDHVLAARQEGASIIQAFHESMTQKGGHLYNIICDICAFANTNGGAAYVGVLADPKVKPVGVKSINTAVSQLEAEIERRITPPLAVSVDVIQTEGVPVIRAQVPRGSEAPYAVDENKIYVRDDTDTSMAVRDEIVQMVLWSQKKGGVESSSAASDTTQASNDAVKEAQSDRQETTAPPVEIEDPSAIAAPNSGVEVVATETRNKVTYHILRDLRNGNIVRNVTRQSARKLWHYAITQVESNHFVPKSLDWHGDIAVITSYNRGGKRRYDLAQRENGNVRVYYGVTEDGVQDTGHAAWRELMNLSDD